MSESKARLAEINFYLTKVAMEARDLIEIADDLGGEPVDQRLLDNLRKVLNEHNR